MALPAAERTAQLLEHFFEAGKGVLPIPLLLPVVVLTSSMSFPLFLAVGSARLLWRLSDAAVTVVLGKGFGMEPLYPSHSLRPNAHLVDSAAPQLADHLLDWEEAITTQEDGEDEPPPVEAAEEVQGGQEEVAHDNSAAGEAVGGSESPEREEVEGTAEDRDSTGALTEVAAVDQGVEDDGVTSSALDVPEVQVLEVPALQLVPAVQLGEGVTVEDTADTSMWGPPELLGWEVLQTVVVPSKTKKAYSMVNPVDSWEDLIDMPVPKVEKKGGRSLALLAEDEGAVEPLQDATNGTVQRLNVAGARGKLAAHCLPQRKGGSQTFAKGSRKAGRRIQVLQEN